MTTLDEVLAALNAKGQPFITPDPYEDEVPKRDENADEPSDLDLMSRFERFTA